MGLFLLVSPSPGAPSAQVTYPEDNSLTAAQYVELGLPAPDRTWAAEDYRRVVDVLSRLAPEDPTRLPRAESASSGGVFGRLVHPGNLAFLPRDEVSLEMRTGLAFEIQNAAKSLLFVYLAPINDNVVFDDELAELSGFLLLTSVELAEVMEVFMSSLPPDDPKLDVRLQGLERMRGGLSEMVAGNLTSLTEAGVYRTPARRRFATHVRASVPRAARHLTELQRREIESRIAEMIRSEADDQVRALLTATLAELDLSGR